MLSRIICSSNLSRNMLGNTRIRCTQTAAAETIDIRKIDEETTKSTDENVISEEEQRIQNCRNKSKLKTFHYHWEHGNVYIQEEPFYHEGLLSYRRKQYGMYGASSQVDPAICWPIKSELEELRAFEKIAYPYTIMSVLEKVRKADAERRQKRDEKQQRWLSKVQMLEVWKKEMQERINAKEAEAREIQNRKERMIEEIRAHFGYTVDPNDQKFKLMLEQKEKEQKKLAKMEKRKQREQYMVEQMLAAKDSKLL